MVLRRLYFVALFNPRVPRQTMCATAVLTTVARSWHHCPSFDSCIPVIPTGTARPCDLTGRFTALSLCVALQSCARAIYPRNLAQFWRRRLVGIGRFLVVARLSDLWTYRRGRDGSVRGVSVRIHGRSRTFMKCDTDVVYAVTLTIIHTALTLRPAVRQPGPCTQRAD